MSATIHDVDTKKERVVLPGVHNGHSVHGPFDVLMDKTDERLIIVKWCVKCGVTWIAFIKDKTVIEFVKVREASE